MPMAKNEEENTVSVRFIRVVNDEWTVEAEFEASDLTVLLMQLLKSNEGRKFASLFIKSLEGVQPFLEQDMAAAVQAEEEKIREEGRKQAFELIMRKAREKGINLDVLIGEEVRNELSKGKAQTQENASQTAEEAETL